MVREATHVLHLGGTDPRCDGPDRAARHVRRPLYCGPVADYRPIPDPPVHDHPAQERDHV